MTDPTDSAIAAERAAALALAVAIKQLAAHQRQRAACRQRAVLALMATENPVSGKPYTFTAADASVGLVREYADWHQQATDLEVAVMLARVELHVAKTLSVVAAGESFDDGDEADGTDDVLTEMPAWRVGGNA